MAGRQSLHQGVQRVTELATERRHMLGAIALDLHWTSEGSQQSSHVVRNGVSKSLDYFLTLQKFSYLAHENLWFSSLIFFQSISS